jgi:hypothetical protein
MTPADRYFDETDAIAESVSLVGLDVLVEQWRRAVDGDGSESARDQRPPRSRPAAPTVHPHNAKRRRL